MMKTYIGSKILQAEPLTLGDYNQRRGWKIPSDENPLAPGYFLRYPDGYVSWTPKAVFEEAYRPVNPGEAAMMPREKLPVNFRERLLREREALFEKIEALDKFITTNPVFATLDHEQQTLMNRQFGFMQEYFGVLDERLALLGAEPASEFEAVDDETEIREVRTIGSDDEPLPFE
jgi:hypothetical protein